MTNEDVRELSEATHGLYSAKIVSELAKDLLAARATPPAGVCVAEGVWDEYGGFVADADHIPIVDCQKIVDGTKPLDGHRVRVWVEDLEGA